MIEMVFFRLEKIDEYNLVEESSQFGAFGHFRIKMLSYNIKNTVDAINIIGRGETIARAENKYLILMFIGHRSS